MYVRRIRSKPGALRQASAAKRLSPLFAAVGGAADSPPAADQNAVIWSTNCRCACSICWVNDMKRLIGSAGGVASEPSGAEWLAAPVLPNIDWPPLSKLARSCAGSFDVAPMIAPTVFHV